MSSGPVNVEVFKHNCCDAPVLSTVKNAFDCVLSKLANAQFAGSAVDVCGQDAAAHEAGKQRNFFASWRRGGDFIQNAR
jgi:hypothetical protein